MASKKKKTPLLQRLKKWWLRRLQERMKFEEKKLELTAAVRGSSKSLLWVWEFSKKAVLICFAFYVVVQVYAMISMWYFMDFSHLGTLIEQTAGLTERCVFAYLIKAGLENIGKIWFPKIINKVSGGDDEPAG